MKKIYVFFFGMIFCAITATAAQAAQGRAMLHETTGDSAVQGEVKFMEIEGSGISIEAEVSNVAPGKHGLHIHQFGSCDNEGKAAGGHYNPDGVQHGLLTKDGFAGAHAGDLGNIMVGEDGHGELKVFIPGLSLSDGEYNVAGRAVILHEKEDDFGQPTGNAGGRIGCGAIIITGE